MPCLNPHPSLKIPRASVKIVAMVESGVVIKCTGSIAHIKVVRTTSCDNCGSKKSCGTGGGDGNEMLIEARNPVGARPGDHVTFTPGAPSAVAFAGIMLYLLPVLFFIGGIVFGQVFIAPSFKGVNPDLVTGMTGLVFLLLTFAGLKIYSAVIDKNSELKPRILKVV